MKVWGLHRTHRLLWPSCSLLSRPSRVGLASAAVKELPPFTPRSGDQEKRPFGYWKSPEHQKEYLDGLAQHLNLRQPSDWNQVTRAYIHKNGGSRLLTRHGNLFSALRAIYPHHEWSLHTVPALVPADYFQSPHNFQEFLASVGTREGLAPEEVTRDLVQQYHGQRFLRSLPVEALEGYPLLQPAETWKSVGKQRAFMEALGKAKGIQEPADWVQIGFRDIQEAGGAGMLAQYSSYRDVFPAVYPDVDWEEIFSLRSLEAQQRLVHRVATQYDLHTEEDWDTLPKRQLVSMGLGKVLEQYDSVFRMLQTIYPERKWIPWKFNAHKLPPQYWEDEDNLQELLAHITSQLHITNHNDWRWVAPQEVKKHGGQVLFSRFRTIRGFLEHFYPEENWSLLLRRHPRYHWRSLDNKRHFLETLRETLGLDSPRDLLSVNSSVLIAHGASQLLRTASSYYELLREVYPEYDWEPNVDYKLPRNYLQTETNRRALLEQIGREHLGVTCLDDWNKISTAQLRDKGGASILGYYSSFIDMLKQLYPQHKWDLVSRDRRLPPGYWESDENLLTFIRKVEHYYDIHEHQDWYRISIPQVIALGGAGLLHHHRLSEVLRRVYPRYEWDEDLLTRKDKRARQRWLCISVRKLFPMDEVVEEHRLSCQRAGGAHLEMDVWVPRYQLALEFNGEHHYKELPAFGSMEMYRQRDMEKMALCRAMDITLVPVPYWWDDRLASLRDMIDAAHPSLLHQVQLLHKNNSPSS